MKTHRFLPFMVLIAGTLLAGTPSSRAANFTVDTTVDDPTATACDEATPNDCSLRGAIQAASALGGTNAITLPAGTYLLTQVSPCAYTDSGGNGFFTNTPSLCIAGNPGNLTIQGAGSSTTVIDGGAQGRVFVVSGPTTTVTVSGVTITHGLSSGSFSDGGGIYNSATLTVTDSVVTANNATDGGGIYNDRNLTLSNTVISRNGSLHGGGGIFNEDSTPCCVGAQAYTGTVTLINSTVTANNDNAGGGGIFNIGATVTITGSTLSFNTTSGIGGGIANFGGASASITQNGVITLTNSTLSSNSSGSSGGGIYNHFNGGNFISEVNLNNVTITNNTSGTRIGSADGGGIFNNGGTVNLENTIIAGNQDSVAGANDCTTSPVPPPLNSQGHNLIQNTTGCAIGGDTSGNIIGQDPKLGLLTDNGGLTLTHALSEGSPAIDAGNPAQPGSGGAACAAIDQRGFVRPLGATCDIGAFERGGAFSVTRVLPSTGGNTGLVSVLLSGSGFVNGATVKLTRTSQPDVRGTPVTVDAGGSAIAVTFDLTGRATGPWDVVVVNPDGTSQALAGGFTVDIGRAPLLFAEVIGRLLRPGRVTRLTIIYGNQGNVDAVGVPLSLSFPVGYGAIAFFDISDPPVQAGQVRTDWSQVQLNVMTDPSSAFIHVPLLLPVVPAGYTGSFQIGLVAPPNAPDSFVLAVIGAPMFTPNLDPQVIGKAVAGAQQWVQQVFGLTISPAQIPALQTYVTNQLQLAVQSGQTAFVTSLGTEPQVYSSAELQLDLALAGALTATGTPVAMATADRSSNGFVTKSRRLAPGTDRDRPPYRRERPDGLDAGGSAAHLSSNPAHLP